MLRQVWYGVMAGAVGSTALNMVTYADMALRGRTASSVPDDLVGAMADQAGLDLGADAQNAKQAKETAENRKSGLGALLGYVTGLEVGAAYGALRPVLHEVPLPLLGTAAGITAMAASDVTSTAFGVTDPRTWGAQDWLLDLGVHVVYGLATVVAFDALANP